MEFPFLIRFKDYWYCSFRCGLVHENDPSGQGVIIRSPDGVDWRIVAEFRDAAGDVRDPRMSVTADGKLMVNASIAYLDLVRPLETVGGRLVWRRSVTWLSDDGLTFQGPYCCDSGINTWRWDVSWHNGFGYSVGYGDADSSGTLHRTADGIKWQEVCRDFFPARRGNEAALTFTNDGKGHCLLRAGGGGRAALGKATHPYREWAWEEIDVIWTQGGKRQPLYEVVQRDLGGPNLITTKCGSIIGAARVTGSAGYPDGCTFFRVDPNKAVLHRIATIEGSSSYPGIVEADGSLWVTVTFSQDDDWCFRLLKLNTPETWLTSVPTAPKSDSTSAHRVAELNCDDTIRTALDSDDRHLRLAAVEKIDDSPTLTKVALEDPSWQVRRTAEERCKAPIRWGEWYLRIDPDDDGATRHWFRNRSVGDKDWSIIPCPALWKQTGIGSYLGIAWYGVEFEVLDAPAGCSLQLLFQGVDSEAWIYVNGEPVGEHTTSSTGRPADDIWDEPFSVHVPAAVLRPSQTNTLYVRAKSGPVNGGIHQPVVASIMP